MPSALSHGGVFSVISYGTGTVPTTLQFSWQIGPGTCSANKRLLSMKGMTVEQLRNAHRAVPFRAFTIRMVDGRAFLVSHPEFLSHSPSGRTVIVHQSDDSFNVLDLLLMSELEVHVPVQPSA
jgi:hypothetical protein